jgi:hypothetical protein
MKIGSLLCFILLFDIYRPTHFTQEDKMMMDGFDVTNGILPATQTVDIEAAKSTTSSTSSNWLPLHHCPAIISRLHSPSFLALIL